MAEPKRFAGVRRRDLRASLAFFRDVPFFLKRPIMSRAIAGARPRPGAQMSADQRLLSLRLPLARALENLTVCEEPLTDTRIRPEMSYSLL